MDQQDETHDRDSTHAQSTAREETAQDAYEFQEMRLSAAMMRIEKAAKALQAKTSAAQTSPATFEDPEGLTPEEQRAEIESLRQSLDVAEERLAALETELAEEKAKQAAQTEPSIDPSNAPVVSPNEALLEEIEILREVAMGEVDAKLINDALAAEVTALRAARLSDRQELEALLNDLNPILDEVKYA